MNEEYNLLKLVAEGDETAFKCIFEMHREKLYNYLFRITKSREISEEIVIDVFVKLWMGRELIQDIHNLDAFLRKVAHNKALDYFRIASRNHALQKMIRQEIEMAQESAADHQVLSKESDEIFHNAIKKLSPQRRIVFTLSRVEGLTHEEIAQKLNLSRNTVRNTISDTLRHMKDAIMHHETSALLIPLFLLLN